MHWPFMFLLAATLAVPHRLARAQAAQDTLAERVADQAFDAIDRCDRVRFYSFFAPVWYHSVLEDSSGAATRHTRDEALRKVDPNSWWAACGDKPRPASGDPLKTVRRIVLGPYVVDVQSVKAGEYVHLDMLEVRGGKIVHEWESDDYSSWSRKPARP